MIFFKMEVLIDDNDDDVLKLVLIATKPVRGLKIIHERGVSPPKSPF